VNDDEAIALGRLPTRIAVLDAAVRDNAILRDPKIGADRILIKAREAFDAGRLHRASALVEMVQVIVDELRINDAERDSSTVHEARREGGRERAKQRQKSAAKWQAKVKAHEDLRRWMDAGKSASWIAGQLIIDGTVTKVKEDRVRRFVGTLKPKK
jgi:hypothetical protein